MAARWASSLLLIAACQPTAPSSPTPQTPAADRRARIDLGTLAGQWQWSYFAEDGGVRRIERERWLLDRAGPADDPSALLVGRYQRELLVLALDGVPFPCSQAPWYRQLAEFDVRAEATGDQLQVTETGYRTAPSPCERGFRRLGSYRATLVKHGLLLHWVGADGATAEETLSRDQLGAMPAALPVIAEDAAPTRAGVDGPWRWTMRSVDEHGDVRDEDEAWEMAIAVDGTVSGTYLRTVTISSGDGRPLACADAPRWRFRDRYTVRGRRDGDQLMLEETDVEAGQHPCLAATPTRTLDGATGHVDGDWLVVTWRGKRRQVLHRP